MKISLDQAELNTILAALRLYQATTEESIPGVISDIAEPDGAPLALDNDEIDELCCRINLDDRAA